MNFKFDQKEIDILLKLLDKEIEKNVCDNDIEYIEILYILKGKIKEKEVG